MTLHGVGRVSAWIIGVPVCCSLHSLLLFHEIPLLLAHADASDFETMILNPISFKSTNGISL